MVKGSSSPWYGSSPAAFEKESAMQASDFAPLHNASAEAVMTGDQPERRWKKRTLVRLPVWIQLQPSDPHRHMGMVRDMNRKGIFFYSDFGSTPGDQLDSCSDFRPGQTTPPFLARARWCVSRKLPSGRCTGWPSAWSASAYSN